jgi:hypothetical protein
MKKLLHYIGLSLTPSFAGASGVGYRFVQSEDELSEQQKENDEQSRRNEEQNRQLEDAKRAAEEEQRANQNK